MTDQWDPATFGLSAPPAAAPAAGSASSSASAPSGAPAQSGGGAWDPAAFGLQPAPAAEQSSGSGGQNSSSPVPGAKTGFLANAAAGAVEGAAGGLNALSDPFGNLIGKPAAIVLGAAHDALAPVFDYHKFSNEDRAALFGDDTPQIGDRVVGAVQRAVEAPSLDTVQPGSPLEGYVRAGAAGAVGMLGMGVAGAAEGATASALAKTGASAAGLGASGGVTGQLAATAAPDEYKPVANLVGNIVGAGIPTTATNVARSVIGKPLSDYVAPAVGVRNALLDPAGVPIAGADGVPLTASANQLRLAGNDLQAITSDPAAVRATLANPPPSSVPGVQLTTAQLTRDPGIGMQEYRVSKGADAVAFKSRQDQQNDARVAALQGVGDGAEPSAVPTYLQQQASDIRSAGDARVAQAQTAAQAQIDQARTGTDQQVANFQAQAGRALDAVPGNLPAGSDAQVGAALRAPVSSQYKGVRSAESQLWDAIDPNGTLAVDMTPIRDKANQIAREIGPNADPLDGKELAIFDTARGLPDVQSFKDLTDLRSRLTTRLREARNEGGEQEVRRLSQLLNGVHDTMAGAANSVDIAPAAPGAASPPPSAVPAPNVGSDVFTPSGQRIPVQYQVADANDLVTSHGADMQPNPAFPPELQPRDRDRAASGVQVARIAGQLQPERLGASSTVADGAPIVGPDGIVESGNGRVMAIRQAYAADGPQAQGYRDWLASQGHDTTGMQQPVLIRRRTGEMTPEQRQAFVGEANAPTTLAMSSTERAASDAGKLSDDVLQHYQPGDVTDPGNRDFARSFIRNVADPGQEGAMVTADGSLSQEGAGRMRAALVHRAYGDKGLSAALAETTDPTARVLAGAMQDAAGPMARLKAGIDAGQVDPAMNIAPALVEATQIVQQARQRGISLADAVAQRDVFNPVSAQAENVLRYAYGPQLSGRMSQTRMASFLTDYARQAQEQSASANLFGANLTANQLLEGASSRYGKATGTEGAYATGNAGGLGQGYGAGRDQARGFDGGAGGQAAPSGSGGQQGGSRVLPEAPLTPNFDQAAAQRYGDARQATVDRVATYKNAPGVGQILAPGPTAGSFKTPDSAIPSVVIRSGPQGASIAQAYLRAGGSVEELSNAAAYALRQHAMRPDGTLDPARYQTWARDRAGFLSQIPDVASRFGAAADAQRAATDAAGSSSMALKQATATAQKTVDDAMTARAMATKALQNSVLSKFLDGSDPVARVGSILRDKATGQMQMAQLAKAVANNPEAKAGLQRAVGEFITRELVGNTKGIESESGAIKSDRFQTFLRSAEPALRQALTPEQVDGLYRVGASLEQTNFSSQVGPGSPTAQLTAGRNETLMSRIQKGIGEYATGGGVGGGIGFAVGGPVGGYIGTGAGLLVGKAVQAAREAGIETVEQLKTQALLNPALFQLLLTKANRNSEPALMNRLAAQFRRISLVGGVRASNEAERDAKKVQPVTRATALPLLRSATPTNALAGPNDLVPTRRNPLFSEAGAR